MSVKIAIVDYGMGNLHSIYRKLVLLGADPIVTANAGDFVNADKIILPGVGHFTNAMDNLHKLRLIEPLNEAVINKKKPVLGICLGMQLMANHSEEGDTAGLGWIDASVVKFNIQDKLKHKVPQTGWNTIEITKKNDLLTQIENQSEFYFLHSFHFEQTKTEAILAKTIFEYEFVSAVAQENIFGTQFHPEKSLNTGIQLLKNFIHI